MPRPTVPHQTIDAILREHGPGATVRATSRRLKERGIGVSEATIRRVLRDNGAMAGATAADTQSSTPEAVSAAVDDDTAECRIDLLRKRLAWVGRLIDALMPALEAGDGAGAGNLEKYIRIETQILKTLHEIEPRADRESEEMRRLGELAKGELLERARANAQ
jgi:hypothetical protein